MFNWICPKCGTEVQASMEACPRCSHDAGESNEAEVSALPAEVEPPPVEPLPPEPPPVDPLPPEPPPVDPLPLEPPEPKLPTRPPVPSDATGSEGPPSGPTPARGGNAFQLRASHYLIFLVVLLASIAVAAWPRISKSGLFSSLRLESPSEEELSRVEAFSIGVQGPIEVSAVRPYYDDEFQARVKAFVSNHADGPRSVALTAKLSVREAGDGAPPLATFQVVVPDPVEANGGVEIDVELRSMGSLQSFPPWDQMRVELEALGAAQE